MSSYPFGLAPKPSQNDNHGQKNLVKKLNSFQISTGDILREEIKKDTDIGKKIVNNMNNGKFVDDEIVNTLLEKIVFDDTKKNKLSSCNAKCKSFI